LVQERPEVRLERLAPSSPRAGQGSRRPRRLVTYRETAGLSDLESCSGHLRQAYSDSDSNVVSPALARGHELAHAFLGLSYGPLSILIPSPPRLDTPGLNESLAVESENEAGIRLGDGVRISYTNNSIISVNGPLAIQ
jgi:hypothetical protein